MLTLLGDLFHGRNDDNEKLPSQVITEELISQIDAWRQQLPQELSWNDDDVANLATEIFRRNGWQNTDRTDLPGIVDMKLVSIATLQTRYKYAKYLIWRPYIYRFLHFPNDLTVYDIDSCQKALNVRSYLLL